MKKALADAGLWYALFDPKDPYHEDAQEKAEYLDLLHVVIAWPILYETLHTRFVRNTHALRRFENYLKKPDITYLDDAVYRDTALNLTIDLSLNRSRPLSLVDCVLRLILEDGNTKIDYLITFNPGDFADVCRTHRIRLI